MSGFLEGLVSGADPPPSGQRGSWWVTPLVVLPICISTCVLSLNVYTELGLSARTALDMAVTAVKIQSEKRPLMDVSVGKETDN